MFYGDSLETLTSMFYADWLEPVTGILYGDWVEAVTAMCYMTDWSLLRACFTKYFLECDI